MIIDHACRRIYCWGQQAAPPQTLNLLSLSITACANTRRAGGFNPQFMPSLGGICTLFSRWLTAASLWVHLLAVNLFAAREMYLEGGGGLPARIGMRLPCAAHTACSEGVVRA